MLNTSILILGQGSSSGIVAPYFPPTGFWIAAADATTGARLGAGERLGPAPASVLYPQSDGPVGVLLETAGGISIKQQPNFDSRVHSWVWANMATYKPTLTRFIGRLEGLAASTRVKRGLSPYVWLRDGETQQFRRLLHTNGTATGATSTTLSDASQTWTMGEIAGNNGVVEILSGAAAGDRLTVTDNTATQLTVQGAFSAVPTGASYSVQWSSSLWFRVRVTSVTKKVRPRGGSVIYEELRLNFVLADTQYDDLG